MSDFSQATPEQREAALRYLETIFDLAAAIKARVFINFQPQTETADRRINIQMAEILSLLTEPATIPAPLNSLYLHRHEQDAERNLGE